jgi:hypothetical protein
VFVRFCLPLFMREESEFILFQYLGGSRLAATSPAISKDCPAMFPPAVTAPVQWLY